MLPPQNLEAPQPLTSLGMMCVQETMPALQMIFPPFQECLSSCSPLSRALAYTLTTPELLHLCRSHLCPEKPFRQPPSVHTLFLSVHTLLLAIFPQVVLHTNPMPILSPESAIGEPPSPCCIERHSQRLGDRSHSPEAPYFP